MNDLQAATRKLREWQSIESGAVFEIGRILKQVKENDLARGEWTNWLKSVGYNPRTAQRYIQIFERFHALPEAEIVPVSKLTELLSLPVDVDAKPFIEDAKADTVREIREKVREVIGKSKSKEKPASRKKNNATSSYISKLTTTLNNLIPEMADDLEGNEGEVILSKLLLIAGESHDVQRKLLSFSSVDIDVKYLIEVARLTPHKELGEVNKLLSEISSNSKGFFEVFWMDVSKLDNFEELRTMLMEILEKLKEITNRSEEWEQSWKDKRGHSKGFDDMFTDTFGVKGGVPATKILGIPDNATSDEAKKRYRELMKLLHPDRGGDALLFDVVKKAYDEYQRTERSAKYEAV